MKCYNLKLIKTWKEEYNFFNKEFLNKYAKILLSHNTEWDSFEIEEIEKEISLEEKLYWLLSNILDIKNNEYILSVNNFDISYDDYKFRVYHNDGYCFDVIQDYDFKNNITNWIYFSEFDGFEELKIKDAIKLIEKLLYTDYFIEKN